MKLATCAPITFALSVVIMLNAQQPPAQEWRPSPADDNKAASWDATIAFISDQLKDASWEGTDYNDSDNSFKVVGVESDGKCELTVHEQLESVEAHCGLHACDDTFVHSLVRLDLKTLDPLSIRIVSTANPNSQGKMVLRMSGVDLADVLQYSVTTKVNVKAGSDAFQKSRIAECISSAQGCSKTHNVQRDFVIGDFDQETARRLARAFMHSSLLCGGVKAVSPF